MPSQPTGAAASWGRRRRLAWILPLLALGAAAAWWVRRPERTVSGGSGRRAAKVATARGAAPDIAALAGEPQPDAFVEARAGKQDPSTLAELVTAYGVWASRADALPARRLIVKQLLDNGSSNFGLAPLLRAVALDRTPRQRDPLWRELVASVARQWSDATIQQGRDLVQTESDQRAKDLLIESLASIPPGKLTGDQQRAVVTDLIDLYAEAATDQKVALDSALGALGGPDVVEILHHRGIDQGSAPLASIEGINHELEASRSRYKKVLEQIEAEERDAKAANAREAARTQR